MVDKSFFKVCCLRRLSAKVISIVQLFRHIREGRVIVKATFVLLSLTLVSVLLTQLPLTRASPSTVLSVSPASITNPMLDAGSVFRINITVSDVSFMFGYQFVLSYDTNVLTAQYYGLFLPFENFAPSSIDDATGSVALAAYTYMGDPVGLFTVDPKPVAWIEFVVDGVGSSSLDLRDSELADVFGNVIQHSAVDGFFSNLPQPLPEFALSEALEIALLFGIAFVWLNKRRTNPNSKGSKIMRE